MYERVPLRAISSHAEEIAARIETEYGKPDLVVAVANGGLYLGDLVAEKSQVPMKWISIGRDLDLDALYSNKKIPYPLARLIHGYRFITRSPSLKGTEDMPKGVKLVVLIDDTVHTGKTLKIAYAALKEQLPDALIVTAAINSVGEEGADITLKDRKRIWFPWSTHSQEYETYMEELRARGLATQEKN